MNTDKNRIVFIGVDQRSSAAGNVFPFPPISGSGAPSRVVKELAELGFKTRHPHGPSAARAIRYSHHVRVVPPLPASHRAGILRDALEQRRPICIFGRTWRTPTTIASAIPLLMFRDGLVSRLRTYSVQELETFTRDLQSPEHRWEVGLIKITRMPAGLPYLIGRPEGACYAGNNGSS